MNYSDKNDNEPNYVERSEESSNEDNVNTFSQHDKYVLQYNIDIMVKQTKSSKTIKAKTLKPGCVPYKKEHIKK